MRLSLISSLRRGVWRRSALFLFGVLTPTLVATAFAAEVREWRRADGSPLKTSTNKKLVGTLEPFEAEKDDPSVVRITMGDMTFRYRLSTLSEADQQYVKAERAKNDAEEKPEEEKQEEEKQEEKKPTATTKPTTKPATPKPATTKPTTTKPAATKPTTTAKPTAATKPSTLNAAQAMANNPARKLTAIPKDGVKRALLVAVDDYAFFADLKYAVADVEAIRAQLLRLGFRPENIVTLKSTGTADLRPTQNNIRRHVDAFLKSAGKNDFLFVHFSGHGFQTSEGARYFASEDAGATKDANVFDAKTAVSLTDVVARLQTTEAAFKWLVVDVCRANPTGKSNSAATAKALKNFPSSKGALVLQSCSTGELSRDDADADRGLFVELFLEALSGKADADGNGVISALDVCKYVSSKTSAASKARFNAAQTPYYCGEFTDCVVAEGLKKYGLVSREDWERAQTLCDESLKQAQNKNFETARKKIDEALALVAQVPSTDALKKKCLERKKMIDLLLGEE